MSIEQQANRKHIMWIPFSFLKSTKQLVFFTIFMIATAGLESIYFRIWIVVAILLLFYFLVSSILSWQHFKYIFTENELCIHEGRIYKKKRFIPLDRIQGINRSTPLSHRMFGLTSLQLQTGANGTEASVKLEMLTLTEAERIERIIRGLGEKEEGTKPETEKSPEKEKSSFVNKPKSFEHMVTRKESIIASVTSIRVFIFLALLKTIYFNLNHFSFLDKYIDVILSFFRHSWINVFLGIFLLLLLSLCYTLIRNEMVYRNFKVRSDDQRIYIEGGVINKRFFSVPKEKVQAISLNANFLQKWFHIVEVNTVNVGSEEGDKVKVSNTLFPFIHKSKALDAIPKILPEFVIKPEIHRLPQAAILVKVIRAFALGLVIGAVTLIFLPEYWYAALFVFLLAIVSQVLNGLHSEYHLHGSFMQLQKGAFFTKLFVTSRSKIEECKVTESFLQRIFGLASVSVYTRADPIRETTMKDIPKEMAVRYYHWYAKKEEE